MKQRFRLFRRGKIFYCEDTEEKKQTSLGTSDRNEAGRLLEIKRQSIADPTFSRLLLRTCISALDPLMPERTWGTVMDEMQRIAPAPSTQARYARALKSDAFSRLRNRKLLETTSSDLLRILADGGPSTNHFLRRFHNFAVGMGWLPVPILPTKLWPRVRTTSRRAISVEEHQLILAAEQNDERKRFYEMLWEIGASQTDCAHLSAEQIDWQNRTLAFQRQKTGTWSRISIGKRLESLLMRLPKSGLLFPSIAELSATDRAAEFYRRCKTQKITGISLHSYRYAWAERAKQAGYPERFAQEALGHNSAAVHRAYAKRAQVKLPSLEEFENRSNTFMKSKEA